MIAKMFDSLKAEVHPNRDEMGKAAAEAAAEVLNAAIALRGEARVVFASAVSQSDFLKHLKTKPIDWSKVVAFHQDEWVGITKNNAISFSLFVREHLYADVNPGTIHELDGTAEQEAECERYAKLLTEKPLDLFVIGIGENGHIAFNDPHVADFNDPKVMKVIDLDEKCRIQQQNDFKFDNIDDVPTHGLTVTIPAILAAENVITVVPTIRKAEAVLAALTGPISEACPASILRNKKGAVLYLDPDSASAVPALNSL